MKVLGSSRYAETLSVLPVLEELDEELVDELLEVLLEDLSSLRRSTITASSILAVVDDELFDSEVSPSFITVWRFANALCAADTLPESRALPSAVMALAMAEVAVEVASEVALVSPD